MKTTRQKLFHKLMLTGAGTALLVVLASGCASAPQVAPDWEWHQLSERYPYPPTQADEPMTAYENASHNGLIVTPEWEWYQLGDYEAY